MEDPCEGWGTWEKHASHIHILWQSWVFKAVNHLFWHTYIGPLSRGDESWSYPPRFGTQSTCSPYVYAPNLVPDSTTIQTPFPTFVQAPNPTILALVPIPKWWPFVISSSLEWMTTLASSHVLGDELYLVSLFSLIIVVLIGWCFHVLMMS